MYDLKSLSGEELLAFMSDEPLLAHFFIRSEVIEDENFPAYAGISIKGGQIRLILNPEKLKALTLRKKIGLLVHEYLHVLLGHCTGRAIKLPGKTSKQNVGQDMSINQLILASKTWGLPEGGVLHNGAPFCYDEGLSAEEYFNLIDRDFSDQEIEDLYGKSSLDHHGDWSDSIEDHHSLVEKILQDYMNSGRRDVGDTLNGSNAHRDLLDRVEVRQPADTSWLTEVKQFVSKSGISKRRLTHKRVSRRYGFPARGSKSGRGPKVAVIIDTSFSMEEKLLSEILGSLNRMCRIMQVDVVMCDTTIKGRILKKFRPTSALEFRGRGGTDMQPAFDHVAKEAYQAVVCFTDGELHSEIKSEVNTLWVCFDNKSFRPKFGRICHVCLNRKRGE